MDSALNWIAVALLLFSALCWYMAAITVIRLGDPRAKGTVFIENVDQRTTAEFQNWWNRLGSATTACGIACQAIATALHNSGY